MTYIVTDACVKCKFMDCVEVCPVDCFYEGENFLVIAPDECIDCGVCEPECPAEAILPDTEPEAEKWLELNREYSNVWPNIKAFVPIPSFITGFAVSSGVPINGCCTIRKTWSVRPIFHELSLNGAYSRR